MSEFEESLTAGKSGESLFAAALIKRGHSVEDLSNIREYQLKDIDFRISKNNQTTTVEVKNDKASEYTGNVFIEIRNRNNRSRNYDGWANYCEADYIAFVQPQSKCAHIVDREELINDCAQGNYRKASGVDAVGYLVPIWKLRQFSTYHCLDLD